MIGVGVISTLAGVVIADSIFAGLIMAFALVALGMRLIHDK